MARHVPTSALPEQRSPLLKLAIRHGARIGKMAIYKAMLRDLRAKIDWFLAGMVAAIFLAWLFPNPGAKGGWMQPEVLVKGGVALIFFLHGVALSFDKLKAGTLRWPLHLLVQGATFLFFPLVGLLLLLVFGRWLPRDLWVGFFFLCALPSTVSSSVAMTAAARGNVPVAVFNATLSSLIGIFLTPLWIGLVIGTSGGSLPLGKVVIDLVLWLLLPLVVGQLVRPVLGSWAQKNKSLINNVDKGTILLLVYTSFCDSVKEGVWTKNGASVLLPAFCWFGVVVRYRFWHDAFGLRQNEYRARRQRGGDLLRHQENVGGGRADGAVDLWRQSRIRSDSAADFDLSSRFN